MIVDRGEIFPSLEVDENHPAVQLLVAAHENALGSSVVLDMSPTVTDGGWFSEFQMSCSNLRTGNATGGTLR